ncbi:unnamed protein product [Paramecium octaurelia]|uniref:Uncharacterized protein n=1 Tax=Paramecium octaurelia TaxID=43137 RepID=A0A8S1S3Q1_PAROT|nr:unnamed protein product [Paramecium octaurelia]
MIQSRLQTLILITLFIHSFQKGESLSDKFISKLEKICENQQCLHLPKGFNDNCINWCVSSLCFLNTYEEIPEDGETDHKKNMYFKNCVKNILKDCQTSKIPFDNCRDNLHIDFTKQL